MEFGLGEVIKYFSSESCFATELGVYNLNLPMLPKLIGFCEPNWIKLSRVSGTPYLDTDFDAAILARTILAFHLASFDGVKCICHIDNQPRNILAEGDRFWFLDFSDSCIDYPEFDLCHLLLFWASDLPGGVFAGKLRAFLSAYDAGLAIRSEFWRECLHRSIEVFDQRRDIYRKSLGKNPVPVVLQNRALLNL